MNPLMSYLIMLTIKFSHGKMKEYKKNYLFFIDKIELKEIVLLVKLNILEDLFNVIYIQLIIYI